YTPYYLHGAGRANSAEGDGRLGPEPPGEDAADQFVYDPDDPVPTRGGTTLILALGVQDQRPVEARADVLVYPSGVMMDALEVTKLTIDLWATSHVFLAGHRMRLEISSSNFPRFDRNLNTGEDQATGTRREIARQTVFHDGRYPSRIVLPIIPR